MSDTPKVIPTAEHARNLEHQRDAALKASNEHFQASVEMAKQVSDLQLANKELLKKLNVATGSLPLSQAAHEITDYRSELEKELAAARRERDEARPWVLFYRDGKPLSEIAASCGCQPYELSPWLYAPIIHAATQGNPKVGEAIAALAAERDRLREENKTLKETRQRTVEELVKTRPYLTLMSECNNLKSALATAQADIAKLCSVIADAFAETAKPLNASVEYDATPTEGERLKKVQEILSSAIDAASATEGGQQPTTAEVVEKLTT